MSPTEITTAKDIVDALERGAEANWANSHRKGNLIHLHGPGKVIMTGDLHDNQRNFDKLLRFADLENHPQTHLILHELLHSASPANPNQCHSYRIVAEAARLKAAFPGQVHYFLGNHAMAQVTRDEVLKNGQPMVKALNEGVHTAFGENADIVLRALDAFILSMPLAVRTENRIWLSHSLPSTRHVRAFDDAIFNRALTLEDMRNNASVRALTWDRTHNNQCLDTLCQRWDVDMFIVGHQSQEMGYARPLERMIILASDHNHGCCLPFGLQVPCRPDDLYGCIKPLASIA